MPQLDFNVAFSNLISIISFFIFLYLFVYFFIFPRLFKMILARRFYSFFLSNIKLQIADRVLLQNSNNSFEDSKILLFFEEIN